MTSHLENLRDTLFKRSCYHLDDALPDQPSKRCRPVHMTARARLEFLGLVTLGTIVAFELAAEFLHHSASRRHIGLGLPGKQTIIVLGYSARRPEALHPLQRWRTQIAVRSMRAEGDSWLVFTGAALRGGPSESQTMAAYARRLAVPDERIKLESSATSTLENVALCLPEMQGSASIIIASDPIHAARARRYLVQLNPEIGARLVAGMDFRFGEQPVLKIATALYELSQPVRDRAARLRAIGAANKK